MAQLSYGGHVEVSTTFPRWTKEMIYISWVAADGSTMDNIVGTCSVAVVLYALNRGRLSR